ncbi:MAG TPA: Mur ligase family protein [Candidatus Saccharimonadales bacterium]
MKITNFVDVRRALEPYIARTRVPGAYTLDRQTDLMTFLGNPQDKVHVVHVAGTSGKTSTAYYAAALLTQAGYKTGLTVSPHVDEINERVQINLTPLNEKEFCEDLQTFIGLVEKSGIEPTYFELLVAFAFWEFERRGVEYAVVEVGLGGLVDSTNVVTRKDKVCIITDLGLDHMHILGDTLGEIAAQKAGIIQLRNAVFCYEQSDEAMAPIRTRAKQMQAELRTLTSQTLSRAFDFLPLFQRRNFELSKTAVAFVLERDGKPPLTDAQLLAAAHTKVPARMETLEYKGKTIILDGAHNAQKLHALVASIMQRYPGKKAAALLAFASHGAYRLETAAAELKPIVSHVVATSFHGPQTQDMRDQSVPPELVREACEHAGITVVDVMPKVADAWEALLARPEPILLVAGSFYLMSYVRPLIHD